MMLDAMTALLSLPRVISHRLSRSRMTVTRKRFSCSSSMLPLMLPMAQHSVFSAPQPHSLPFSCAAAARLVKLCFYVTTRQLHIIAYMQS